MKKSRLLVLLLAATASCVSPPRAGEASSPADPQAEEPASELAQVAEKPQAFPALEAGVADLERELEESRMALEVAELTVEKDLAKAGREVQKAEREVGVAREKWAHYRDVESQLLLSKSKLAVDRAVSRLESQRQDLQGILEIYEGETEARAKDEIIRRNRKGVEFAEAALEQARLQARMVAEFDVPQKLESLQWGLADAEASLQQAQDGVTRAGLEGNLNLLKKRNKLSGVGSKLQLKRSELEEQRAQRGSGEGAQ